MSIGHEDGFPPFTLVTASSEAALSGCEAPGEPLFRAGVFRQEIPVGTNEIHRLGFLLFGRDDREVDIPARIHRAEAPGGGGPILARPLAEERFSFGGAGARWLEWTVNLTALSGIKVGGYIRAELDLPGSVGWIQDRLPDAAFPGSLATGKGGSPSISGKTTFCFRVSPPQPCFWPSNVLPESSGSNRFTGQWRSDPASGLPQWIEASWRDPLPVAELELDFPDSPECPTRYRVETFSLEGEGAAFMVEDNIETRVTHRLDRVASVDRIRTEFLATRGGESVSVCRMQLRRR